MKLVKPRAEPAASATIEFDRAELEFLAALMQKLGGRPEGTRAHADKLRHILEDDLGYDWDHIVKTQAYKAMGNSAGINFKD